MDLYSIDVFESPTLLEIYSKTITIMVGINAIALAFIIYSIIFHGKTLGVYRWLLLICFISGYVLDLTLAVGHIVPYLPATIFYCDGILGKYGNAKLMLSCGFSMIGFKLLMMCVLFLYRYAMTFTGRFQYFMSDNRNLVYVTFVHGFIGFVPMLVMILDDEDPYVYVQKEIPALRNVKFGSNVTYMPRNIRLQLLVWPFIVLLIATNTYNTLLMFKMRNQIEEMRVQLSESTYKRQRMLFLSVSIENVVVISTVTLPLLVVLLAIAIPIPYGSHIAYVLFTLMSFQTSFSTIMQLVLIKPFRNGIRQLFWQKILKKKNKIKSVYIGLLIIMLRPEFIQNSCYKIMFYLGLVDIGAITVSSIISGYLSLVGSVFCSHPTLEYVAGGFGLSCWCNACCTVFLLALNRLLDLTSPYLSDMFFKGWRTYVILIIPTLFGLFIFCFTDPCLYSSLYYACFFDPYFGLSIETYLPDYNTLNYANYPHSATNISIIILISIVYIAIILALIAKTRMANSKAVTKIQRQTILQACLICALFFIASGIYVWMQFLPIPDIFILVGQFFWQGSHGDIFDSSIRFLGGAIFIYLIFNRSMRKEFVKLILPARIEKFVLKTFYPKKIQSTVTVASQVTTRTNNVTTRR